VAVAELSHDSVVGVYASMQAVNELALSGCMALLNVH
jgi:hypothetical protein